MIEFVNKYAKNYSYSQNGEEALILEALIRMKVNSGTCVEVGGNDGRFCSNTALLLEHDYWSGLFVEADYNLYLQSKKNWANNPRVRHQCSRVDEHNVNAFVDDSCDVLSLDTDGADYKIFRGLKAKPKIVIIEIDSSLDPERPNFNKDGAGGYLVTVQLGIEKGYFLLCHTGNLVLVDNQYRHLFPEIIGDGLSNSELYFNRGWMEVAA